MDNKEKKTSDGVGETNAGIVAELITDRGKRLNSARGINHGVRSFLFSHRGRWRDKITRRPGWPLAGLLICWLILLTPMSEVRADDLVVDGGSTYYAGSADSYGYVTVGNTGSGTIVQGSGTTLSVSSYLLIGKGSPGTGTYNFSGGTISAANETIGDSGNGTFTQSGGTNTIGNSGSASLLVLGNNSGSYGSYSLGGNSSLLTVSGDEYIGKSGSGSFTQSGGTHVISFYDSGAGCGGNLVLGSDAGISGNYHLQGGSLSVAQNVYVGDCGQGSFTQSGGSFTVGSTDSATMLVLGNNCGGDGSYSLSGNNSRLTVYADEYIGYSGIGSFIQTGGTHTIGGCDSPMNNLFLGFESDASGSYTLSGNSSLLTMSSFLNIACLGNDGTGSFTQSGGTFTMGGIGTNLLYLGVGCGGYGSYKLSGDSSLLALSDGCSNQVFIGYDGSGLFTQAGGSFTAGGSATWGELYVGYCSGSGSYNLSGTGSLLRVYGEEYIGYAGLGIFTFPQFWW